MNAYVFASCLVCGALSACNVEGTGSVQVFVEPEDSIPQGIAAGTGDEDVVDGWTVTYEKFLVVFGNFRAHRTAVPDDVLAAPATVAVDMRDVPAGGLVAARFDDVAAARWDRVGFDLPNASAQTTAAPGVSAEDLATLVDGRLSLFVAGRIEKADGQSCAPTHPTDCVPATTVRFSWPLSVGTAFDGCAPAEGDLGFAVPSGGTAQVKPTIHGDHWLFNNITQGAEITERRAQWVADADLDRDGETTLDELSDVDATDVFSPTLGYNLTGALTPIETARDFLEAQARTLGDFQGDGECPERAALP
jgi:hypothetical protein